jgi:hypothetical protein
MKGGHLFLPLILLIYLLVVVRYTPTKSGFWTIIATIAISWVVKETRMGPKRILEALEMGARNALTVVTACACAGIVIGVVTLTGVGLRIIHRCHRLIGRLPAAGLDAGHGGFHHIGYGTAHHSSLYNHGDPGSPGSDPDGRGTHCRPPFRLLFRHHFRHHTAGGPGRLCGGSHRRSQCQ